MRLRAIPLGRWFELQGGGDGRLLSMEGLRGLAVLLVFFVHYTDLIRPWLGADDAWARTVSVILADVGNAGVDLFFMLSGYLIYGSLLARRQPFAVFLRRRAQRLYPTFVVVFALYVVLSLALPRESKIPGDPLDAGLYLVANLLFLPGVFDIRPMIAVAWSLSYEVLFYLTVPCLFVLVRLRDWPAAARTALCLGLTVIILVLLGDRGEPMRMGGFAAGMLLYETTRRPAGRAGDLLGLGGIGLLLGIWLVNDPAGREPLRFALLWFAFYAICRASLAGDGVVDRLFRWKPLRWLGNMSYSYYLIHGLVLKATTTALARVMPPPVTVEHVFWLALPPMFLLTAAVGAVLFLAVEKPLSLAKPKRAGAVSPPPPSRAPAAG
ncbi:MAG: acyltransferase family protein [Rhodospirillaceae bacterium]